jgi:hypothetical protein
MTNRLIKRLLAHKQKQDRVITVTIKRLFLDGFLEGNEIVDTFRCPISKLNELPTPGDIELSFTGGKFQILQVIMK